MTNHRTAASDWLEGAEEAWNQGEYDKATAAAHIAVAHVAAEALPSKAPFVYSFEYRPKEAS